MTIHILLADNHTIMREGLRTLIDKQSDFTVVAMAEDGRMAVNYAQKYSPDIVVMDIGMPVLNGVEASRQIKERIPATKIIALSMHSEKRFVVSMLQAGASGYLLKDCAFEELAQAVRDVYQNRTVLSQKIVGILADDLLNHQKKDKKKSLKHRDEGAHEVLRLLSEGKTFRQITASHIVDEEQATEYLQDFVNQWLLMYSSARVSSDGNSN
jgi:two-component system response regulator NreC